MIGAQSRELKFSRIGFGAGPLGSAYGKISETTALNTVAKAIEAGITFFDVSPYYGLTEAESVLGRALKGRRSEVTLCTKSGRNNVNDFDFSAAGITRSVHNSLSRLRTDYLDVLLAHDIEFGDPHQILDETYGALVKLQEQGLCRAIGMSGYPIPVLQRAVQSCRLDVILTYCHGTLWDTRIVTELIPLTQKHGVSVINASPLGMGLLSEVGPPPWHPAGVEIKQACAHASAMCRARGISLPELALSFSLSLPGIACTLIGISSETEVAAAIRALHMLPGATQVEKVRRVLAPIHDQGWLVGGDQWG